MSASLLQVAWGAKKTPQPKSGGYARPQKPRLAALAPKARKPWCQRNPHVLGSREAASQWGAHDATHRVLGQLHGCSCSHPPR